MRLSDNALTTLEAVKELLGIDPSVTQYDVKLTIEINNISAMVESMTGRTFGYATYTNERRMGSMNEFLYLRNYPIKEVDSVVENDEVVDPSNYEIDTNAREPRALFHTTSTWRRTARSLNPAMRGNGGGMNSYKVSYKAGYILPKDDTVENPTDLPPELEGLVLSVINSVFKSYQQTGGNLGLTRYKDSQLEYWFSDTANSQFQYRTFLTEQDMAIIKRYKNIAINYNYN